MGQSCFSGNKIQHSFQNENILTSFVDISRKDIQKINFMETFKDALGKHILAEFYECDSHLLNDALFLEKLFNQAARLAGATILGSHFHAFSPVGASGVVIIMESHFSIHTWPEYGYAAVDFFTCSPLMHYQKAYEYIAKKLHSQNHTFTTQNRGTALPQFQKK